MFGILRKNQDKPMPTRVALQGDMVSVFAGPTLIESFAWSDLVSVRAWKQDCWGVDRIWIGFDARANSDAICVHEEMEGYQGLVAEMQRRCPGFREDWWNAVAFPAFAQNHTIVWERPQTAGPS
jgi:hypothetical protein